MCDAYREQIAHIQNIEDEIKVKKLELENSFLVSESDVKKWLENIKEEISISADDKMEELKVAVFPAQMQEAKEALIQHLSPVYSDTEVKTYAPNLVEQISAELTEHYDCQEK